MIKVGDKVKVVDNFCSHRFNIGDILTCIDVRTDESADFEGPNGDSWAMVAREYDTIHETHTIGTLDEIGAQVGDVVECLETGCEFTVCSDAMVKGYRFTDYRIVTQSKPQGPVITETVKRIVPGVYGKVEVTTESANDVFNVVVHTCYSRSDLIAARDVFNRLIDAMPEE